MPADTDPVTGEERSDTDERESLRAAVVHNDDDPDRRTVYPADADEDELLTHWLTANENSFVNLRELR